MTDDEKRLIIYEVLKEIDELMSGSEKCITRPDDPSGVYTEWILDSEAFREKLRKRMVVLSESAVAGKK